MADSTPLLPPELEAALRAPIPLANAERTRRSDNIMAAVAELPVVAAPVARRWMLPPSVTHWRRRGVLAPAGALAVALLVTMWVGVTSFTNAFERSGTVVARAEVLGDTVIPRLEPRAVAVAAPATMYDTLYDTVYDTMRIVRFALHAPSATRVSLVHTLASGVAHAVTNTVARDLASGLWELHTIVAADAVAGSFEFIVNDTDRVPVRAVGFSAPVSGRRSAARLQPSSDTAL